jgi:hypothetical protein
MGRVRNWTGQRWLRWVRGEGASERKDFLVSKSGFGWVKLSERAPAERGRNTAQASDRRYTIRPIQGRLAYSDTKYTWRETAPRPRWSGRNANCETGKERRGLKARRDAQINCTGDGPSDCGAHRMAPLLLRLLVLHTKTEQSCLFYIEIFFSRFDRGKNKFYGETQRNKTIQPSSYVHYSVY